MKILYVVTGATFGGAVQHTIHLMKFMAERGHKVGLAAAPEPRLMREAREIGAMIFPNRHFVHHLSFYHDLLTFIPVFKAIHIFQPDLVSGHSTKAGLVARFCAAVIRKPVIFTAHGWGFGESRAWWTPWMLRQLERFAARVTAKIICVSDFDRDLALQLNIGCSKKVIMIHNGMPPEAYTVNKLKSIVVHGLEVRQAPILITVGRLAPPKDFETLLEALQKLDNIRILIVGDGPNRQRIETLIRKNGLKQKASLLGQREDVPNLLANAEIFVLSSRKEGLPRTIIEAMLAGLPVVATRVGGVPELVEDNTTGFLVPPGNSEALAAALQRLIKDPGLRRAMGEAGRKKALLEFTLDRMLKQTLRVYEEVLQ